MITRISDGLVKVTGTVALEIGMWKRCKSRKWTKCRLSQKPILIGELVYRPLTNSNRRSERVLAAVMENYIDR